MTVKTDILSSPSEDEKDEQILDIKPRKRSKFEDLEDDLEPANEEIDNFTSQSKPGKASVSQINQDYSLNSSKDSGESFENVQPAPAATQDVEKQTEDKVDLTQTDNSDNFEDVNEPIASSSSHIFGRDKDDRDDDDNFEFDDDFLRVEADKFDRLAQQTSTDCVSEAQVSFYYNTTT